MAQPDYSSSEHRLQNLADHSFVEAYACVRRFVFDDSAVDGLAHFLRGYMAQMEKSIAKDLDHTETSLVGMLVDIGERWHPSKTAKDGGGSATG